MINTVRLFCQQRIEMLLLFYHKRTKLYWIIMYTFIIGFCNLHLKRSIQKKQRKATNCCFPFFMIVLITINFNLYYFFSIFNEEKTIWIYILDFYLNNLEMFFITQAFFYDFLLFWTFLKAIFTKYFVKIYIFISILIYFQIFIIWFNVNL